MDGAGEIPQQLKEYFALAKDLGLIPGAHIRWLITACNSSARHIYKCGTHKFMQAHIHVYK